MTWRDRFRPLIAATIASNPDADKKALDALLRKVWDSMGAGPREYWPYKVWRDEINRQCGRKPKRLMPRRKIAGRKLSSIDARVLAAQVRKLQLPLFGAER